MTHRADQILDRIVALDTARVEREGVTVFKHRRHSLAVDQDDLPAHSVDFGPDEPAIESTSYIDSVLTVPITAAVAAPTEEEVRAKLLEHRREIHRMLMADPTLGLPFVIVVSYGGALEPDFSTDGEVFVGTLTSNWLVTYRMNVTDPGD